MSVASEIARLQTAKANIKTSIENKGVTVGDGTIDTYASKIDEISTSSAVVGTKSITSNGTYKAVDDNLDGYSEVEVACGKYAPRIISFDSYQGSELNEEIENLDTSNLTSTKGMFSNCSYLTDLDLSNFDTSNVINMNSMFNSCNKLTTLDLSNFDTSKVTNFSSMFYSCSSLTTVPQLDTSKGTYFSSMFYQCFKLTTVPQLDTSKGTDFGSMFYNSIKLTTVPQFDTSNGTNFGSMFGRCFSLTDFGGLENLGQAYSTTQSANNYRYKLDLSNCTALTEQSLINVLTNLYDIKTKGCKAQQVILGTTNLAKLTSEEGQTALSNAQAKGWTVS